MRKTLLTGVMSVWLFTGAMCGTTDLNALVAQVQAATAQACSYVATIETILAIFNSGNAQLQQAQQIADSICAAVGKASIAGGTGSSPAPAVNGIPIVGHRVVK